MEKAYEKINEKKARLKLLKKLNVVFAKGDMPSKPELNEFLKEKGAPKNLEACNTQITKLQERIGKEEMKA